MSHVSPFPVWVALPLWLSLLFLTHVVLPIALPLMSCLSHFLKLGRTPRGKVSHIFTLEALDVSIHLLLILSLAHHLGILIKLLMPCSSTPSCLLLHHQVTTIFIVDLDLLLGVFSSSSCGFGWGSSCCFTKCLVGKIEVRCPPSAALEAFDML